MSVEWQFLITLNEQLLPLKDPVAIQEIAVRLLGEHLHANRVNYAHIDGDDYVVGKYYTDGVPPSPLRGPITRFGRAIIDACRRGETVVGHDHRRCADALRHPLAGRDADGAVDEREQELRGAP